MKSLAVPALAAVLTFALAGCKHTVSDNVAATVNNHPITYAELDKFYQSQVPVSKDRPNDDQVMIQKLELLRTLIDNQILLQRAEKLGLMATDADVDAKFTELKAPYTQEEFQRLLASRKMSADDLKAQLRQDLSIQKLINKEITSHIAISDKDVAEFYNTNKSSFNFPEPQIHMAQILVTPVADPNVRNLKNDKAQSEDQARSKIENLATRLKAGEDFAQLAQNYSEDTQSAQNGGDLGFVPESALEKANPDIRKAVSPLAPGQVSQIVHTSEGYRILKLVSKEPAGQRELSDPRVAQNIRETLMNRKDQLLRAAFYEVARNEAKVENFFAESIASSKDKK